MDAIKPAVQYSYKTILDGDEIDVMAYNVETILAENEKIIEITFQIAEMLGF